MTTPNGNPTGASPARPQGYSAGDAAVQAGAAGSEAKVIGDNQDTSSTGAADATGALGLLKKGQANPPGVTRFTADD
jgi:hypothetical protein